MDVKFRSQQSIAEHRRQEVPIVEKHTRALLDFVVTKARAEQKALVRLAAEKAPNNVSDLLNPLASIALLTGHVDDVAFAQADEVAKLEHFALGVTVIAKLTKKLGVTLVQLREMDVKKIAKHVSMDAAIAAKDAFANPDVKLIAAGGEGPFSWERGEFYADPNHLTSTFEQIGLDTQAAVEIARDYYRGGVVDAGFEAMEFVRAGIQGGYALVDSAVVASGSIGLAVAPTAAMLRAGADFALLPATLVSENVSPEVSGHALVDVVVAAVAIGGHAAEGLASELRTRAAVRSGRAATVITRAFVPEAAATEVMPVASDRMPTIYERVPAEFAAEPAPRAIEPTTIVQRPRAPRDPITQRIAPASEPTVVVRRPAPAEVATERTVPASEPMDVVRRPSAAEVATERAGPVRAQTVTKTIPGPKNAGPKNAGPKNVAPKNAAPKNAGLTNAGPKNVAPKNAAPKDVVASKPTPKAPERPAHAPRPSESVEVVTDGPRRNSRFGDDLERALRENAVWAEPKIKASGYRPPWFPTRA